MHDRQIFGVLKALPAFSDLSALAGDEEKLPARSAGHMAELNGTKVVGLDFTSLRRESAHGQAQGHASKHLPLLHAFSALNSA